VKVTVTYSDLIPQDERTPEREPVLPALAHLLSHRKGKRPRRYRIPAASRDAHINGLALLVRQMQTNYRVHHTDTAPMGCCVGNVPTDDQFRKIADGLMASIQLALGGFWYAEE